MNQQNKKKSIMEFKDLKIGQEVLVVTIGNNSRHGVKTYNAKVAKIGRKWFKVKIEDGYYSMIDIEFSLENGKSNGKGYMPEWQIFKSKNDYNEYIESPNLRIDIVNKINKIGYSKLVEILNIINK